MESDTMTERSSAQFLQQLQQRSIELHERDGRLQVSAPPGALDAELRAELARRKPELLDLLRRSATPRPAALVPADRSGKIPQTQAQQGMWLLDHFSPNNPAYNIPQAFVIDGHVDLDAFQRAVDRLLDRHEALRTFFYEEEGDLFQAVSPDAHVPLGYTDLSAEPGDPDQRLLAAMRQLGRQPFQLDTAPLIRFHLFRLANGRHVAFLNVHHIVADAQSLLILRRDLAALYQAGIGVSVAPLPELPVQFADYAVWAEQKLADGAWNSQVDYWKQQLAGALPVLDLPFARPSVAPRTPWGATVPVSVPATVRQEIMELARQENATAFMVLLAAFAVLLYRISGHEDFSIGSPFTHRNQPETRNLVGLFVNMLVLRCRVGGPQTFRDVVRHVRTTAVEAYANGDLPFQEVVRALKPDPRTMRSPLFQIMFAYEAAATGETAVVNTQLDTSPGTARYDLTLELKDQGESIAGCFEYCTDLFSAPDIHLLAARFSALTAELCHQPDRPVAGLPLLASAPASVQASVPAPEEPPSPSRGFWSRQFGKLSQRRSRS